MKKVYLIAAMLLAACAGGNKNFVPLPTPNVDFIEQIDVRNAPHQDSFLTMLAINYRSYAIWNAREVWNFDIGELFANKAIAAFSGDTPMPEVVDNWNIADNATRFDMNTGLEAMIRAFRDDATETCPEIAAEAQAKFDCWVSATASGQSDTADECRHRFSIAMNFLQNPAGCDSQAIICDPAKPAAECSAAAPAERADRPARQRRERNQRAEHVFYPDTAGLSSVAASSRTREGVIIVNNVNIPGNLLNPVPVPQTQPIVFNQNIFGGTHAANCMDEECHAASEPIRHAPEPQRQRTGEMRGMMQEILDNQNRPANDARHIPQLGDQTVSRDEFINMMVALRNELIAIHSRLDNMPAAGDKAVIKVQQIPLEPKQHIMEEIFEIRFDFDRYEIKPEYEQIIRNLVATAGRHKNVKISVVGHTDTVGTADYNFALGGRRAEAVRRMLIQHGIPSSQIIAVSSGKNNLKVPTGPGVPQAENRRVRVVKETHWTEPGGVITPEVVIQQGQVETMYGKIE